MGKADLHIHTRVSDGFATVEETMEYIERHTDLDVVAITDHEDASGGLRAREFARQQNLRVEVVVGAEITTLQGHLLALFIEYTPKSFRPIDHTIAEIHRQGGLAVVPHPMSWLLRSVGEHALARLAGDEETGIDAIETHSPSLAAQVTTAKARRRNGDWAFTATGSSDAHHLAHIGAAWTEFPGSTAEDLYRALALGTTTPVLRGYPPLREVGYFKLAAGIVWGLSATPRKMVRPLLPPAWRGESA